MAEHTEEILRAIASGPGEPERWVAWPGGWPGEIDVALVDAIFSARAVYRTGDPARGVLAAANRWRDRRGTLDSLPDLLAEIDAEGPETWAASLGNAQHAPSRRADAPGGPTKAAAVRQAAALLIDMENVRRSGDVTGQNSKAVVARLREVSGIGPATSSYFSMLLGFPGVKPDVMVHRFLREAAGRRFSDGEAVEEVTAAAARLGVTATELEHAIWSWQRNQ